MKDVAWARGDIDRFVLAGLYLLNNDFVRTQTEKFGERLGAQSTAGTDQRIPQVCVIAFAASPR